MATPIWKDTYYTSTANTFEYYITDVAASNSVIFRGKSYKAPNANIFIKLNDICSNHLSSELTNDLFSNDIPTGQNIVFTPKKIIRTFRLYDANNTLLNTYVFSNNWDYETDTTVTIPINRKYINGMYYFTTTQPASDKITVTVTKTRTNQNTYTIQACGDYALYYVQSNGAWSSFAVDGKVIEGKNMNTFNYRKVINNNKIADRENIRYQSNIKQNWSINTGWLKDDESENLFNNLLTSNNIYLHKISENKIWPVHITDTQATNKQFNNEKKLISYTINLESDNLLIRK